jgi:hypothetical protein
LEIALSNGSNRVGVCLFFQKMKEDLSVETWFLRLEIVSTDE